MTRLSAGHCVVIVVCISAIMGTREATPGSPKGQGDCPVAELANLPGGEMLPGPRHHCLLSAHHKWHMMDFYIYYEFYMYVIGSVSM